MTGRVAEIWRHPIKSHGRETLSSVALTEGQTMPWDRTWAVAHEKSKASVLDWSVCGNFSRVAKIPALQAINASLDEATETLELTHPDRPTLSFRPDLEHDVFLDWVSALMPENSLASSYLVRVPGRGMTDTDYPSISMNNLASNQSVAKHMDTNLDTGRWRGNIWFDGMEAWAEIEWVGKTLQIGTTKLSIREPIKRCKATTANPKTGLRDADTLAALQSGWGHQNFGVYGEVVESGTVSVGDSIEVLN